MKRIRHIFILAVLSLFLLNNNFYSETHTVQFGGTVGLNYSPKTLIVNVGDTILWQGDFNQHPLSSTTIPGSAEPFHVESGLSFAYPVTVAGTYDYICDLHFNSGMTGSFSASPSTSVGSLINTKPAIFNLEQNYPNPFNPDTKFRFSLPQSNQVSLKIFNILGKEVAILINEFKTAGTYEVNFNAADLNLPSGIYLYQLKSGFNSDTKKFTLLK